MKQEVDFVVVLMLVMARWFVKQLRLLRLEGHQLNSNDVAIRQVDALLAYSVTAHGNLWRHPTLGDTRIHVTERHCLFVAGCHAEVEQGEVDLLTLGYRDDPGTVGPAYSSLIGHETRQEGTRLWRRYTPPTWSAMLWAKTSHTVWCHSFNWQINKLIIYGFCYYFLLFTFYYWTFTIENLWKKL